MNKKKKSPILYKVCRICLNTNQRMFPLSIECYYNLIISNMVPDIENALPQMLCWECRHRLQQYEKFRRKALNSHAIMTAMISQKRITMHKIMSIDRKANKLDNSLKSIVINVSNITECSTEVKEPEKIAEVKLEDTYNENNDENYIDIVIDHDYNQTEFLEEEDGTGVRDKASEDDKITIHNDIDGSDVKDEVKYMPKIKVLTPELIDTKDIVQKVNGVAKKNMKSRRKVCKVLELDESVIEIIRRTPQEEMEYIRKRSNTAKYMSSQYKCDKCYRAYVDRNDYDCHMRRHTDAYGAMECDICKLRSRNRKSIKQHIMYHMLKYACRQCAFTTTNKRIAVEHVKFHQGNYKKYKCTRCQRDFNTDSAYKSHLRLLHSSSFVCSLCGHTFLSDYGVRQHQKLTHRLDLHKKLEGPRCETCELVFLSQAAYDKHLLLSAKHVGEVDPTISNCNFTVKAYKRKRVEPSVTCEQCGESLVNFNAYRWHFRRRHPAAAPAQGSGTAPVVCDQCGLTFKNKWMHKYHMWRHSGVKQFKCEHCDKSYTQKTALRNHMAHHTGRRDRYTCPVCTKQFSNGSNLKRHMLGHEVHQGKRFSCQPCEKLFTTKHSLQSHMEHVHQKKPWPKRVRPPRRPAPRHEFVE